MLLAVALASIPYYALLFFSLIRSSTTALFTGGGSGGDGPANASSGHSLSWLAALFSPLSDGAISVVDRTPALSFVARSASFGPHISEDDGALLGYLIPLEAFAPSGPTACPPVRTAPQTPDPGESWIALVQRGGCGFVQKVREVQALGARAAVVGGERPADGEPDELVQMYAPGDASDIAIPSTYVTYATYAKLQELVRKSNTTTSGFKTVSLVILPDYSSWEWYSPIITFIFLLLLPSLLTLLTLLVHRVRMARQEAADRAPPSLVFGLPWRVWGEHGLLGDDDRVEKANTPPKQPSPQRPTMPAHDVPAASDDAPQPPQETYDGAETERGDEAERASDESEPSEPASAPLPIPLQGTPAAAVASSSHGPSMPAWFAQQTQCAICLADFERGDRVRILPCRHVFHLDEVDEWLVSRKKLCPVCKADVTLSATPLPTPSSGGADDRRGWRSWWARRATDADEEAEAGRRPDERSPLLA
ncbi:hypothetical protein AURDEDRAFT_91745 [Auricularia subglabra TFB-10046 SS5]|nr:hypothetical protein AURDEDRAFT_91745 [Auricularia subglabra TFB-10046 SS5]